MKLLNGLSINHPDFITASFTLDLDSITLNPDKTSADVLAAAVRRTNTMPILEKYRHYFDIDPDYFPAVNEAVINSKPEMWKKFFPHDTFVRLIKNTVSVLDRKQKLSIWVEGAYGTGKSHAVLTLKKLLDASEAETKEYF